MARDRNTAPNVRETRYRRSGGLRKYYLDSLIAHSIAIEGSTLTEAETQMLFDEGIVAGGKPLVYHLMNVDLKNAYELAKEEAKRKTAITSSFLQILNATLMRTTGYYWKRP